MSIAEISIIAAVVGGIAALGTAVSALTALRKAWRRPTVHVKLSTGKTFSLDATSGEEEVQKQLKSISDEVRKDLNTRAARIR